MTKIAAIYVRCSTREQEKEGYSLQYQEDKCKEYIAKNELAYFKTYADSGISGATPIEDRKGMSLLFEDAKKKKFDILVFYGFDRIARDNEVAYEITKKLKSLGIKISECQHDIDTTTPDGKLRMGTFFLMAESERLTTRERSIQGTQKRKEKIGWCGGKPGFGYVKADKDKYSIPIINEEEAIIVRLIYELYWKDGHPISNIPLMLSLKGIDSKKWTPAKVTRILKEYKHKYDGGLINDNKNNVRWPKILDIEYPTYPRIKEKKKKTEPDSNKQVN